MMNTAQQLLSSFWQGRHPTRGFLIDGPAASASRTKMLAVGDAVAAAGLDLQVPKVVVVGTQSSGKSSFLNKVIGLDLLPTGRDMVTRAPLKLEMRRSTGAAQAEFGRYDGGQWLAVLPTIELAENPGAPDQVKAGIESLTRQAAGESKGVTNQVLHLRVWSPQAPDVSLVDLPGLTVVACRDRGQPADIQQRIRAIALEQIRDPDALVVCVMAARPDLETDLALGLVKEVDPQGARTLGVLTKPDLVQNPHASVADHLSGHNTSRDLRFVYGYFAIMTRDGTTLDDEQTFFAQRAFASVQTRCGVPSVSARVAELLSEALRTAMPELARQLGTIERDTARQLEALGRPIPANQQERVAELHLLLTRFAEAYASKLDVGPAGGSAIDSAFGCELRDAFVEYRQALRKGAGALVQTNADDIQRTLDLARGNHMDASVCSVAIVERCLLGTDHTPLRALVAPSDALARQVAGILQRALEEAVRDLRLDSRFPELAEHVVRQVRTHLLDPLPVRDRIEYEICREASYLWTENKDFLNQLQKQNVRDQVHHVKELVAKYVATVVETFCNAVPKTCMHDLVRLSVHNLLPLLGRDTVVPELLRERSTVRDERSMLETKLAKVRAALKLLHGDSSDDVVGMVD